MLMINIDTRRRIIRIDTRVNIKNDADFERKHPRDKDGKFGAGGSAINRNYGRQIDKAIRGELRSGDIIQVLDKTPKLYTKLGLSDKPIGLPQRIIAKANVDKHCVQLNTIRRLPQLIENPIMVFESATESDCLVSLLPERDMDGNYIVAILKPTQGRYNIIPSVYGKENIKSFLQRNINDGKLKYIKKKPS